MILAEHENGTTETAADGRSQPSLDIDLWRDSFKESYRAADEEEADLL